jgi:hypothetical protein
MINAGTCSWTETFGDQKYHSQEIESVFCFSESVEGHDFFIGGFSGFRHAGYFSVLSLVFRAPDVPPVKLNSRIRRKHGHYILIVEKAFFRPVADPEAQCSRNTSIFIPQKVFMISMVKNQDKPFLFLLFCEAPGTYSGIFRIPYGHINLSVIIQQVIK